MCIIVKGKVLVHLKNLVKLKTETWRTRQSAMHFSLDIPRTKRKPFGPRAFQVCEPSLWNSLPDCELLLVSMFSRKNSKSVFLLSITNVRNVNYSLKCHCFYCNNTCVFTVERTWQPQWIACPLTVREVSRSNPTSSTCHAGCQEVGRCHTTDESALALKPRIDVTRSPKLGYQWNPGRTSPEVQNWGISETQGRHHQKSKTGVSVKPRTDITRSPKLGYQWNPGQTSPEVQNWGISETQGRHHQKSKTGVSVKPRMDVTRSPKLGYQWNPGWTSPEVQNWGISETQDGCHQKSKTGVSVKPRTDITRSPKLGYQWNPGQMSPEVQNWGISETQDGHHQKSKTGVSVKPRADITRSPKQGYQWNPGQTSPEVQNWGISRPTKRTHVLQIFFKKKKEKAPFSTLCTQKLAHGINKIMRPLWDSCGWNKHSEFSSPHLFWCNFLVHSIFQFSSSSISSSPCLSVTLGQILFPSMIWNYLTKLNENWNSDPPSSPKINTSSLVLKVAAHT